MVQSKVIHMLFQSTFPRGERRSLLRDPLDSMHFNPRSHVGNDRLVYPVLRLLPYFNPRSHVGNDQFAIIVCICVVISIHVPTWGTTGLEQTYTDISSFQSTFPRGERLLSEAKSLSCSIFQSTFPRGERRYWKSYF